MTDQPPLSSTMTEAMLTTVDNPYDPFKDWAPWYAFDRRHDYNTSGYLARIAKTSDDLSIADYNHAIEMAIDEIVEENINGMYRKVTRQVPRP